MKIYSYALLVLSLLIPAVTVCGAEEAAESTDNKLWAEGISTEGLESGCFYARDVNNWEAVNKTQLIVYAPTKNRAYLLSIAPPSTSLRFNSTIAFAGRDRICGRPGERLLLGSGVDRRHMVMDVRRLNRDALEAYTATRDARKKAVEPAESPGAEVETVIQPAEDAEGSDDS